MFMIMPRPARLHAPVEPQQSRTLPRATRVKAACDRCRLKKIKCDGVTPCSRCMQDKIMCVATKKATPSDPLSASREYIQSLESQQSSLIRALRRMRRLLNQPLNPKDMLDVAETLKACGFDFDALADASADDATSADHRSPGPAAPGPGRSRKRKSPLSDASEDCPQPEQSAKRSKSVPQSDQPSDLFASGNIRPDQLLSLLAQDVDATPTPTDAPLRDVSTSTRLSADPFLGLDFASFSPPSVLDYWDPLSSDDQHPDLAHS